MAGYESWKPIVPPDFTEPPPELPPDEDPVASLMERIAVALEAIAAQSQAPKPDRPVAASNEQVPGYVMELVKAYVHRRPLDFHGARLPGQVRAYLDIHLGRPRGN